MQGRARLAGEEGNAFILAAALAFPASQLQVGTPQSGGVTGDISDGSLMLPTSLLFVYAKLQVWECQNSSS